MEPIILASGSPRRREFFSLMGLPFTVINADIDESLINEKDPEKLTGELAMRKVEKALVITKESSGNAHMYNNLPLWICGADTVVALNGEILGKPANQDEAAVMLNKLSGREHRVCTSVALFCGKTGKIDCRSSISTVNFAVMNDDEIDLLLNSGEWQGAAGAYRIQGLAGLFIKEIKGEPSNVAGLPLHDFYVMLKDNGYHY